MNNVVVSYNYSALQGRVAINLAIVVIFSVLALLIALYVRRRFHESRYSKIEWEVKFCVGLFFLFIGELIRSTTILDILNIEGAAGTYLSEIEPIFIGLGFILVGGLCSIRVISDRHWVWISTLAAVIASWVWWFYF